MSTDARGQQVQGTEPAGDPPRSCRGRTRDVGPGAVTPPCRLSRWRAALCPSRPGPRTAGLPPLTQSPGWRRGRGPAGPGAPSGGSRKGLRGPRKAWPLSTLARHGSGRKTPAWESPPRRNPRAASTTEAPSLGLVVGEPRAAGGQGGRFGCAGLAATASGFPHSLPSDSKAYRLGLTRGF